MRSRFKSTDAEELVGFLSDDTWPFHVSDVVDQAEVRQWIGDGRYDNEGNGGGKSGTRFKRKRIDFQVFTFRVRVASRERET